jgi:hypothetical protein
VSGARRTASRVAIAIAIAGVLAAAFATRGAADPAPASLRPDLVVLAVQQDELLLDAEGGRRLLRFTTEIANVGAGPLEVFPSAASSDCDGDGDPANDRDTSQRLYADSDASGSFDRAIDAVQYERRFGCMRFHPPHEHWHVFDIAAYALRREGGGRGVTPTRKVGYCLSDNRVTVDDTTLPPGPFYPFGPPGSRGCDGAATQGISVGWTDVYGLALPGQAFDVGKLRPGTYCLTMRADPHNLLEEADETDNVRRVRLLLRADAIVVRKLPGRCRS